MCLFILSFEKVSYPGQRWSPTLSFYYTSGKQPRLQSVDASMSNLISEAIQQK